MTKTGLVNLHVYANNDQKDALEQAAEKENRSLSNFLLNLGLQRALELGVNVPGYGPKLVSSQD